MAKRTNGQRVHISQFRLKREEVRNGIRGTVNSNGKVLLNNRGQFSSDLSRTEIRELVAKIKKNGFNVYVDLT